MSPVRLLVQYKDGSTHILECMITHKNGNTYGIIAEKNMLMIDTPNMPLSYKDIAYRMITNRNSNFLARYNIFSTDDGTKYQVRSIEGSPDIDEEFLTLQDAMQGILGKWCEAESINMKGIL